MTSFILKLLLNMLSLTITSNIILSKTLNEYMGIVMTYEVILGN